MRAVDVIVLVGWIIFWIYWLVASTGAKAGQTQWTRFAGMRIGIALVVFLLLRVKSFKAHTTSNDPWTQGIGLAIFFAGLGLAIWARIHLGRNWGMPMSQKIDSELVTSGPYRRIRHPIYSGILLAMVGTAVAVSLYWLVVVFVLGSYFLYSAMMEERFMTKQFPDTYLKYNRSTKMLIPFIL